jgi:hypothetical protein
VVGKTVTLLSTEDVGKYKYRARAKGSDKDEDWVESENLYIVNLQILASYDGVLTDVALMEDGYPGVEFKIAGLPTELLVLTSYEWRYEPGITENIGLTPYCSFSSQAKETIVSGRWYAHPGDVHVNEANDKIVPYIIKCKVTIDNENIEAKEAKLNVNVVPGKGVAGFVTVEISGFPLYEYNPADKKFHVKFTNASKKFLERYVTPIERAVYVQGIFKPKITVHESVHIDQFIGKSGIIHNLSGYVTVDGFWNRLVQKDLTADTKEEIERLVENEKKIYKEDEFQRMANDGHGFYEREAEAYAASDRIYPQYYWQKNWPVQ